jgi:hypothetical protein
MVSAAAVALHHEWRSQQRQFAQHVIGAFANPWYEALYFSGNRQDFLTADQPVAFQGLGK